MTASTYWDQHPTAGTKLRQLYAQNVTIDKISTALGTTRGSVSGKLFRLVQAGTLERRVVDHRPKHLLRAGRRRPAAAAKAKPFVELPVPSTSPKQFFELKPGECRWPIGDTGYYCADPISPTGQHPYCPYHERMSRGGRR